jgi:hypothetical protein
MVLDDRLNFSFLFLQRSLRQVRKMSGGGRGLAPFPASPPPKALHETSKSKISDARQTDASQAHYVLNVSPRSISFVCTNNNYLRYPPTTRRPPSHRRARQWHVSTLTERPAPAPRPSSMPMQLKSVYTGTDRITRSRKRRYAPWRSPPPCT